MEKISITQYIKSDLWRYAGNAGFSTFVKQYIRNASFRYNFYLRACRSRNPIIRIFSKLMHHHLTLKYGVSIPWKTQIGYGLFIGHPIGIIINGETIIGNNCNLSQFTTIGTNHERAAVIGDNVYIGPNVCVVEDVRIGDNSTIGAGSVVVKDVPEDSTVAGCPAKVISMKTPGRYILNRYSSQKN